METCAQILDCRLWSSVLVASSDETSGASSEVLARRLGGAASLMRPTERTAEKAPAKSVPPILRRRLTPLGRSAATVLFDELETELAAPDTALVFASRWGDIDEALLQLRDTAEKNPLSPTRFASSVHNGIAAVLTIAKEFKGNAVAVAGGPFSLAAGFESAVGLLSTHRRVALVSYDQHRTALSGNSPAGAPTALALILGPQIDCEDPQAYEIEGRKGPYLAVRTRALREGESPDPLLARATLGGETNRDREFLAWLLLSESPTYTQYDRRRAIVWAKDRPLDRMNGFSIR